MKRKLLLGIVLIMGLILGGCNLAGDDALVQEQVNRLLTQAAAEYQTALAKPPVLPVVTDTPVPQPAGDATATATPDATLAITSIQETGAGRAVVNWDAFGNFPSGFTLVWTTEERKPVYPEDSSAYTGDPNARSALLSGVPGFVYIVRVCRTSASGCDLYSNAAFFTFTNYAPTPTPDFTQTARMKTAFAGIGGGGGGGGGSTGTPKPTAAKFVIVSMSGGTDLKAHMIWTSDTDPTYGFRIYYSTTSKEPKQGNDLYHIVSDPKAREAYVSGLPGLTYYFRVCKYEKGGCSEYTPVYSFSYPGTPYTPTATKDAATILIATIKDTSVGNAEITWGASGSFPEGFRVLYSATSDKPKLSDEVVIVPDGAARSATVSGTPGVKYYFRICKYAAGACTIFSPVASFTFADIPEEPGFTLSNDPAMIDPGSVRLTWSTLSPAPAGLKVLWEAAPDTPLYPGSVRDSIDGAATEYLATGLTPGTSYAFRLCKFDGSICTAYSAILTVTAP